MQPPKVKSAATATLLTACLLLPSCITTALWKADGTPASSRAATTHKHKKDEKHELSRGSIVYPQGVNQHYRSKDLPSSHKHDSDSGFGGFIGKIAITPITLLLDLITYPIQAAYADK